MGEKLRDGVEAMARTGFFAKGVVYLLLGFLGVKALGAAKVGSTESALAGILRAPLGSVLLAVLATGLAWYAIWRLVEAFADANGKGREPKGLAARSIYLASGAIYATLALDAFAILLKWQNDSGHVRSFAGTLLNNDLIAMAAGLVVGVYGLYQLWKGLAGKLSGQLNEGAARREAGRWVIAVSRIGLAGRGLVFVMLGYWLITHPAAAPSVASSSGGAAGPLRLVERLPQGDAFLLAAAAGLVAYGVYQLVHSRYRRIAVPSM